MTFIRQFDELGRDDVALAGGKGANLGELTRAGLPVPPGFVVTTDAYGDFVSGEGLDSDVLATAALGQDASPAAYREAAEQIRARFADAPVPAAIQAEVVSAYSALGGGAVAVRSSATAEDLAEASFAGQQDTYLNVSGEEALLGAVRDCWASLWTDRALAYRARQGIDPATVRLAVVVQEMVSAESAGVMFTANPDNGRRDETVISAAWGLGEAVVSGQVDTDNLVVQLPTGTILSRTVADKQLMTSYADRGTTEQPVPVDQRRRAVLSDLAATELAALGAKVTHHFGAPQDIEWARASGAFFLLQARPITALKDPEGPVPTDWTVPDPSAWYLRGSIVEQLPDPLSPLFADLIDPAVTRSLRAVFAEILGMDTVRDEDVSLPTLNGYAYYRYSRSGIARLMLVSYKAFGWLFRGGERSGIGRWRGYAHPRYAETVARWTSRPVGSTGTKDLLAGVEELVNAGAEYYTSVQTIIPIAASSEVAFTKFYETVVRRPGDPPAATFLLGYDSAPIRAEKSLYDLASWVRSRPGLSEVLLETSTEHLVKRLESDQPDGTADEQEWVTRFREHLRRYGHTVYNLDPVNAVPADDPAPLIDTLRFYLRGGGVDPYTRQRASSARREAATQAVLARLDPVRARVFIRLLRWAQRVGPVREDALADVGLAWPQLRRMLRELGRRLVRTGALRTPDDVYWLTRAELVAAVDTDDPEPRGDLIEQRKQIWRGQRRATPPQILPVGTWMDRLESLMPAASADQRGDVLRGVGASSGRVTATARVLAGPQEFGTMQPGDVLVASITTPAWTPLFALASGVVTDVGGPLSHSSIVAREYGIPAVLGTAVATRRVVSGQRITVDGNAGTVTLREAAEDNSAEPDGQPEAASTRPRRRRARLAAALAAAGAVLMLVRRLRRPD